MFAFVNPICWLKKTTQLNPNTKKLCDSLSIGGLVPVHHGFNLGELGSWWVISKINSYWNF